MKRIVVICGLMILATQVCANDWPQWMGANRDNVWKEDGILDKFPEGGIKIKWRAAVGAGYSSPTVAGGKVFVLDRVIKPGGPKAPNPFARVTVPGVERLVCLDESSGKELWVQEYSCDYSISYNAGPRTAPAVDGDHVYTYGAEGDLQCRAVADGKLVWQKHPDANKTPMWGFASSPLIEGDNVIVYGADPDGIVMAFNKTSGEPAWKALPAKEPGYSSPIMIDAGGKRQLIVWHTESLSSLDPANGKVNWSEPFVAKQGMAIATPRCVGDMLLISSFYNGSMLMRLDKDKPAASKVWKIGGANERKTEALHSVLSTPVIAGDFIYGVCSHGQLRGLKALTGQRIWETFAATSVEAGQVRWANAFIVTNGDREFLFNEGGDLIIAKFAPTGYDEISRSHLIDPTNLDAGRPTVWCQPAFANRCIYVKNDKEIVCGSLAK